MAKIREEQKIFDDLAALCASPGYIHALGWICFFNTTVATSGELTPKDLAKRDPQTTLIRTELNTLVGLAMRAGLDFALPSSDDMARYIDDSYLLLSELHESFGEAMMAIMSEFIEKSLPGNPFTQGAMLREAIFYGAESAYTFQYRDLAPIKYANDAQWLAVNKGLDLEIARAVCVAVVDTLNMRLLEVARASAGKKFTESSILTGFSFTVAEIAEHTGHPIEAVTAVLECFAYIGQADNSGFKSLHDFNAAYSLPLIKTGEHTYCLLQLQNLTESLYDSPFYWMNADTVYSPTASGHRGDFAENFAFERLSTVFGSDRVFKNVEILQSKGETLGEIDILVVYGGRALVFQAKSKKLTLVARKGNDQQLQKDFKAAVQDAVDQAVSCSKYLQLKEVTLRCRDDRAMPPIAALTEIIPISIVSEHYPALAFQAKQFLKVEVSSPIVTPLVFDVFALDAMAEMINTPLRLMSYLLLRTRFEPNLITSHEYNLLGLHLSQNLWLSLDTDLVVVDDSVSKSLDVAMVARRDNVEGSKVPDGILTRFQGTDYSRLIEQIDSLDEPAVISLGLALLEFDEETIIKFNGMLGEALAKAQDRSPHNILLGFGGDSGVIIHVNVRSPQDAEAKLVDHCHSRMEEYDATTWLGAVLRPDGTILLARTFSRNAKASKSSPSAISTLAAVLKDRATPYRKQGRNDPCACGSGVKYKKCCGFKV